MSDRRPVDDRGVDRHEERRVIEEPGYAESERVTHDYAAERRQRFSLLNQIIWTLLGILEIMLGLRFLLRLMAANPQAGFAAFVYGITEPFLAPFTALVGTPAFNGSVFEITTLIAMLVYALFTWILVRLIGLAGTPTTARSTSRSVREDADLDTRRRDESETRTTRRD